MTGEPSAPAVDPDFDRHLTADLRLQCLHAALHPALPPGNIDEVLEAARKIVEFVEAA
jgi:hypothetical protein